jgi:hypothetical protein
VLIQRDAEEAPAERAIPIDEGDLPTPAVVV